MKDIAATALAIGSVALQAMAESGISVLRAGSQPPTAGAPENFTGAVRVDSRFKGTDPARIGGGLVSFEAEAHTAWHTHPLGQTLFVTSGVGLVQHWGGEVQEIKPGDIVWIPPGVKHWHGATPGASMSHLAFSEALDGKSVEWMEHVTDDQYPH
jgi:quercetin dioxygenase-like cupin family protein